MSRSKRSRHERAVQHATAALCAASILLLLTLSACLAPSPTATKPATAVQEVPYEDMSASIAMGKPQDALASYEKSLSETPQAASTRILHARLFMLAGKLPEAREELGLVLASEPKSTEALYTLSMVAGLQGSAEEQEKLLKQVVQIDAGHADALAALGEMALEKGDIAAASAFFERSLAHAPSNITALIGQGNILFGRKDLQGSRSLFDRAVTAQPDYPFAYIDRARVREALSDSEGALQDISQAISLDPQYPWSYLDRGKLYIRLSHRSEAIADFSMAIRLGPDQFEGYALRGELLSQAGDAEGALADWQRVVTLKPDYGPAYVPLARLAWARADWPTARDAFRQAYLYQEDEHSLALCAAVCSLRAGKPAEVSAVLTPVLPQLAADSWYRDTARFLMDRSAEPSFLGRINRERNAALKARMLFYYAEYCFANNMDRAGLTYLIQIEGKGAVSAPETQLASAELARRQSAQE